MRVIISIVIICFTFFIACNDIKPTRDNLSERSLKKDTSYNYLFRSIPIDKEIDDNTYTRMLIMGCRGGRTSKGSDTLGFFRINGDKIYYLSSDYSFLRKRSQEKKFFYEGMDEQLFFDFSLKEGSSISFSSKCSFPGKNTFLITDVRFDNYYKDYIFSCKRIDSLSTSYQSDGGYFMQTMKIGERVGFTEFTFLDYDYQRLDVYLPKDSTWKLFGNVSE